MARWLSLGLLIGVIVVFGVLFYRVMVGFLLPLFLAAILVVIFRPLHQWLLPRVKHHAHVAAGLTTLAILAAVLLPLAGMLVMAGLEAQVLLTQLAGKRDQGIAARIGALRSDLGLQYDYAEEIRYLEASIADLQLQAHKGATAEVDPAAAGRMLQVAETLAVHFAEEERDLASLLRLQEALEHFAEASHDPSQIGTLAYVRALDSVTARLRAFKIELLGGEFPAWVKEMANPTRDEVRALSDRVFSGAPDLLRAVGGKTTSVGLALILGLVVMILGVFFFLADGPKMMETLMRLSPLDDRQERELLDEFDRISRAVVVATLLSAVVQGILAGIGFYFAGVGSVFLLMLLTIVFALIPFVGAATVWIPVSIWIYLYDGRPLAAALLALYGAGIVSVSDNVIKPLVLHGQSNLHPLLALLSVLGGVQALGPIGILVGPMIVVFLQTLLSILQREVLTLDEPRGAEAHPAEGS